MWRWVTRGLIFSVLALLTPALFAQTQFYSQLDAPDPGVTQTGMILVKGWALDPGQITKVELYVDDQFQHNLVLNLPRIDIVEAFPNYPGIHQARPGFITGFMASRFPNGAHTVEVRVYTSDGVVHPVGRRTITVNNTLNQAPFGSVDLPDASGVHNATGSFPVNGWAADTDGIQRVDVLIDGGVMQSAVYGDPRPDVGATYPDYPNAQFSGFVAHVDTTRVQNGVHLLEVQAVDRLGMSRLIGRRQVQILNNDIFLRPFGYLDEPKRDAVLYGTQCGEEGTNFSPPVNPSAHITPVRGWALDLGTREDVGRVSYVELLVDGVRWLSSDDCGVIFGQFANCYGLPRYDVARYYPTYPDAPRAGFFFTLDVGTLMNMGVRPGNHYLRVRVGDRDQTFADLPNRDGIPVFFQCADDTFDLASLGFIDFPQTFDYVGGEVTFHGWAIDENGGIAAVEIIIDGNYVGSAQYGFSRPDVRQQFPQFTIDSGWRFTMDTRMLSNSRHRLTVRVLDARGKRSEIGSVDFYVANNTAAP